MATKKCHIKINLWSETSQFSGWYEIFSSATVSNCDQWFLKQFETESIEAMKWVICLSDIGEGSSIMLAVLATIWNSELCTMEKKATFYAV